MLNIEDLKKKYSFLYEDKELEKDIFFCNCGNILSVDFQKDDMTKHQQNQNEISEELDENNPDDFEYFELLKAVKSSEIGDDNICSSCKKNFSTINNQKSLILNNKFFVSEYNLIDNKNELTLFYSKTKPYIKKDNKNYELNFNSQTKYLKFNKETKDFYFKDFDKDEVCVDLENCILYVNNMLIQEKIDTYNIYDIHVYINQLSKYVSDIKNIDIVNELLSEVRKPSNNGGIDSIKKIISIFIGIIKYSNLSTIALTKGCKFLYDLMLECDIPNGRVLRENNLTSPVDIFNYLSKNYIKKINEEVNEDNKDIHNFTYKSSRIINIETDNSVDNTAINYSIKDGEEKQIDIKYKNIKDYKNKVIKDTTKNKLSVLTLSEDATASKFIYKKINKFSDYKQILKYFKFYNKHEIINILQKYDLDLITRVVDLIYFRDKMSITEFDRVVTIIQDFSKNETLIYKPTLNMEKFKIDYNYVEKFDFSYYDDSIIMMNVLEFDPRKHFNKIKTYFDLKEYHDNLVKYYNVVSDSDKGVKFKKFVDRFRFLEGREDYNGPLELRLISTPSMLIKEGNQMKHSASSYSKRVISENYIIAQIFDKDENKDKDDLDRFTVGFTFDSLNGIEFDQVKGYANKQGSDRFKMLLMEFLKVKDISYRPIKDLKMSSVSSF